MKSIAFFAAPLLAAATAATPDSATTPTGAASGAPCAAQSALEACLAGTGNELRLCQASDYPCLCGKYTPIMTCFNRCPDDSRIASYQQRKDLYCNAGFYTNNLTATRSRSRSSAPSTKSSKTKTSAGDGQAHTTPTPTVPAASTTDDDAPGPSSSNGASGPEAAAGLLVLAAAVAAL
ncbi:hypothetical protein GGS23DRAFT_614074 [Durotheca rogersii]|uniref:uncharacterized protein n=1 Tax=Durotheca rogersii TaxID=419775 RepID=UPI00221E39B3|nr:uncharacterized protein GGS23DRAFT_614074 [Durotheca rogersii]KAI5860231.1 hypothetical protein GGS23DRAFT_614074 [Durotheca rogersii]